MKNRLKQIVKDIVVFIKGLPQGAHYALGR